MEPMRTRVGVADSARVVVHQAGALSAGIQRCNRCGIELPVPLDGGWEHGALIRHEHTSAGERMTEISQEDAVGIRSCDVSTT